MYKLEKIFEEATASSKGEIMDQQQLDDFSIPILKIFP